MFSILRLQSCSNKAAGMGFTPVARCFHGLVGVSSVFMKLCLHQSSAAAEVLLGETHPEDWQQAGIFILLILLCFSSKAAFVEHLNGSLLFDSLYAEDREAAKLAFLPGVEDLLLAYPCWVWNTYTKR